MGYSVYLAYRDDREAIVDSHSIGSTVVLGGSSEPAATITYNYGWSIRAAAAMVLTGALQPTGLRSQLLHLREQGLRALDGKPAGEWIEPIRAMTLSLAQIPPDLLADSTREDKWSKGSLRLDLLREISEDPEAEPWTWPEHRRAGALILIRRYINSEIYDSSYWIPAPLNAAVALHALWSWAEQHREAWWTVR